MACLHMRERHAFPERRAFPEQCVRSLSSACHPRPDRWQTEVVDYEDKDKRETRKPPSRTRPRPVEGEVGRAPWDGTQPMGPDMPSCWSATC